MIVAIIGRKIGMTHVFQDDGRMEAVTAIEAGPCTITQIKTSGKEGYDAVQLGFGEAKRLNKPRQGHLKKLSSAKYLREFRIKDTSDIQLGQRVDVGIFQSGELIDVSGISKGKGFAGGVKRHHFSGGPKTHGQSDRHRAPGAIGSGTDPGRVRKGLRMAGHMGDERVTVRHLRVVRADPDRNLLLVRGAVPGAKKGLLIIKKSSSSAKGLPGRQ